MKKYIFSRLTLENFSSNESFALKPYFSRMTGSAINWSVILLLISDIVRVIVLSQV